MKGFVNNLPVDLKWKPARPRLVGPNHAINLASGPESRFFVLLFRTAIASAFRCPTTTTRFLS